LKNIIKFIYNSPEADVAAGKVIFWATSASLFALKQYGSLLAGVAGAAKVLNYY